MAISPKHLEEEFQNEVTIHEENIDNTLAVKKITKGQSININPPKSMNRQHFLILKQRYINAGWTDVSWNSDQREGDWLTFKY